MTEMTSKIITASKETYRVSFVCNLISSLTFVFLTAGNIADNNIMSVGTFALGALALLFSGFAAFSLIKLKKAKA